MYHQKNFYQKVKELCDNAVREEGSEKMTCLKELENLLVTNNIVSIESCGVVSKDIVVKMLEFLIPKPMRYTDYYQQVKRECPLITKIWFQ